MTIGWNDNSPIYRQLKDRVIGMMSVQKLEPAAYDDDHVRILSAIAAQASGQMPE